MPWKLICVFCPWRALLHMRGASKWAQRLTYLIFFQSSKMPEVTWLSWCVFCWSNFLNIKITGMRCSIRHFKTSHVADAPPESACEVSSVGISNLFPELLTIIFSYLEVRDKGCAAQVWEFGNRLQFRYQIHNLVWLELVCHWSVLQVFKYDE